MNTKKIASISGTIILTAFAVFIGRASTKFTGNIATNLFATNGSGNCTTSLTGGTFGGSVLLTTGGSGPAASITSSAGTHQLYNTSTCTAAHRIHFNI